MGTRDSLAGRLDLLSNPRSAIDPCRNGLGQLPAPPRASVSPSVNGSR